LKKFNLICAYFPNPDTSEQRFEYRVKEWDPDFKTFFMNMKANKPLILCGDLNIGLSKIDEGDTPRHQKMFPTFETPPRKHLQELLGSGTVDAYRYFHPKEVKYTWFSFFINGRGKGIGSRIDYFFVSQELMHAAIDSTIDYLAAGSDHCPIELLLDGVKLNSEATEEMSVSRNKTNNVEMEKDKSNVNGKFEIKEKANIVQDKVHVEDEEVKEEKSGENMKVLVTNAELNRDHCGDGKIEST